MVCFRALEFLTQGVVFTLPPLKFPVGSSCWQNKDPRTTMRKAINSADFEALACFAVGSVVLLVVAFCGAYQRR